MRYLRVIAPLLTLSVAATMVYRKPNIAQQHLATANMVDLEASAGNDPTDAPLPQGSPLLCDVLGRDRSINIFSSFTRDMSSVNARLLNPSQNSTILAPINSAIMSLPRKVWEDSNQYKELGTDAYEGQDGQTRARENTRKFVEAHIVIDSPWEKGIKVRTLGGDELWWEEVNGVMVIMPEKIEVARSEEKAANGMVWVIKGVRNHI